MRILSIDASSKIGWSILEDKKLVSYGVIEIPTDDSSWPWGIFDRSNRVAENINGLVLANQPFIERVVIERANSSSFRNSQNFIDWFHFAILQISIANKWNNLIVYVDTAQWRKLLDMKLSKEDKLNNQKIYKAKKSGKSKKELGLKGKITKKHLAVRFVNLKFNLDLKQKENDIADAICIGLSSFI